MKNIFPIFSLAIIFFFCGFILLRFSVKNFLIDNGIENRFTDIVLFDAKDFFKKEKNEQGGKIVQMFVDAVKKKLQITVVEEERIFKAKDYVFEVERNVYINVYANIKWKIENYAIELFPFRLPIVQNSFLINSYFGNEILPNNMVDLGDGYLVEPLSKVDLEKIYAFVQKMGYFKRILDSLGIPLVYAQYPSVICSEDNISKNSRDQNIQAKNKLMQKLRDIGIPVIDLHEEFHKKANNWSKEFHRSLFYKTDNHWQGKTAIWAGQIISEKLNDFFDFSLRIELLDTVNFSKIFVKKWLGSWGEKVISLYPKEDFYIYSPKYTTDISWLFFGYDELFEGNGSFDSVYHLLFKMEDRFDENFVELYPLFSYSRNNNLSDGKKILLIGDSFNNPLSRFFALVFKDVNYAYLRSSLLDDYLANKPDVVVVGTNNTFIRERPSDWLF